VLLRWTGACAAAGASPTCDVLALGDVAAAAIFGYPVSVELKGIGGGTVASSPSGIDCPADCQEIVAAGTTVTLLADADSASVFDGWSGPCAGTDPICTVDVSAVANVSATFGSVVSVEEDGAGTGYAWGRTVDDRAIGGSYRWERRAGASATFAFSGTGVALFTRSGPAMGEAEVTIDGADVATIDGYAPTASGSKHRFGGLAPGGHELTVTVLGTKGAAARGTRVAVDAIRWGGTLRPDPAGPATWGSIATVDGSAAISEVPGASARFRFDGTGVWAEVLRGPGMGRAELWLDGAFLRTVDLYAANTGPARLDVASGLADGTHVVRLVVAGTHRSASIGSAVAVDGWVVR